MSNHCGFTTSLFKAYSFQGTFLAIKFHQSLLPILKYFCKWCWV